MKKNSERSTAQMAEAKEESLPSRGMNPDESKKAEGKKHIWLYLGNDKKWKDHQFVGWRGETVTADEPVLQSNGEPVLLKNVQKRRTFTFDKLEKDKIWGHCMVNGKKISVVRDLQKVRSGHFIRKTYRNTRSTINAGKNPSSKNSGKKGGASGAAVAKKGAAKSDSVQKPAAATAAHATV